MSKSKQITDQILGKISGVTFASISYTSTVKLLGGSKNPYQTRVQKVTENARVMLASSSALYINMINRRLADENKAPYEAKARTWGTRVPGTPYIHHVLKGGSERYYLEMVFQAAGTTHYTLDGELITDDVLLADILKDVPAYDELTPQQGGLDNQVVIRSIALANILKITVNGETFDFS